MSKRVWLITGCSSGFGEEFVLELLRRGDKVIATGRSVDKLAHLHKEGASVLELDVTSSPVLLEQVVEKAAQIHGRIDGLINNAGYMTTGALEEISAEETFKQFNVNVFGVINITRAVLPLMRARKSGVIVNIGSYGGFVAMPSMGVYNSSKFALEAISESLQQEVAHLGIKVMIVEAGSFRTSLINSTNVQKPTNMIPDYTSTQRVLGLLSSYPGKQPGDPKKFVSRVLDVATQSGVAVGRDVPVRLALGPDAVNHIKTKCEKVLKDLETWNDISVSTNFD